ncbi:MAG: Ig-like domain-containing protein [Actinomycetes bacterium]
MKRRSLRWVGASSGIALLAVAGCSSSTPSAQHTASSSFVTISPSDQTGGVRPDSHVQVHAKEGHLQSVSVSAATGRKLAGAMSADHRSWTSRASLLTASTYDVTVNATDAHDGAVTIHEVFTTLTPKHRLAAAVAPLNGETVGVGQPIAVYFPSPVQNRAAVERRFHVSAEKAPPGAWHWYSDTEMHYRPPSFWPADEKVALRYDLRGLDGGNSTWGDQHRTIAFTVGAAHVSKVNALTHSMQVFDDGKPVKTFKVSTGRDKYPTTSGIHVVLNKNPLQVMDSATVGIPRNSPDGYFEKVPWSVRISNSGEFVHDAPWSVHSQGHVNVSHGCVNLSPADSKWFFDWSRRGDIVVVSGTPRRLQQGNGYADWNLSWSTWTAGDPLA